MKKYMSIGLAAVALAAAAEAGSAPAETEVVKKSIVPAKYAGKYKGAADAVSEFIKAQTEGQLISMFSLCRANAIPEDKVAHYEGLFADKANNHGIEGRARMTLGNMLRAKARKEGKLVDQGGNEHAFEGLAKPAVSGAAAKAQEDAASASGSAPTQAPEAEEAGAATE